MEIKKTQEGSKMTFELAGWMDTKAAPELGAAVEELDESVTELVFECTTLEYISSSGLRQIVAAHKKMKGSLVLKNLSAELLDVLGMTGLDKRLRIES